MNDKLKGIDIFAAVPRTPAVLALSLLALAGCGGGGGSEGGSSEESVALQECRAYAELTGIDFGFLQENGVCEQFDDGVNDLPQLTAGFEPADIDPLETPSGPTTADEPLPGDDEPFGDVGGTPAPEAEGGFSLTELEPAQEFGTAFADVEGSSFYAGANNSARLQGPLVGDGSVANNDILRSLPFRVAAADPGLELRGLAEAREKDTRSSLIGVLFNSSAERHCFVELDGIRALDADGAALETILEFSFVDGTVARSSVQTDTCIEAGTGAYVDLGLRASAGSVAGVSIDALTSTTGRFERTETEIIPLAYSVEGDELSITVVNRGLVNVETGFLNVYMLDERGVFLGSALASSDEQLAPGAEAVLNARVGHLPGQVSSIRVLVDFDNI